MNPLKQIILVSLLLLILLLTACGTQEIYLCSDGSIGGGQKVVSNNVDYICPNGQHSTSYASCDFPDRMIITQKDAETKSLSFVNGHLRANGWQATLVNVNRVDKDWLAQMVVSKYDQDSFETVVKIDGESGFATCDRNCDYLKD